MCLYGPKVYIDKMMKELVDTLTAAGLLAGLL